MKLTFSLEQRQNKMAFFVVGGLLWSLLMVLTTTPMDPLTLGRISTLFLFLVAGSLLLRSFCARNSLYFVIFLFISMYIMPAKLYFFDGMFLSAHHELFTYQTTTYVTLLFAFFLLLVNVQITIPFRHSQEVAIRKNDYVYWILFGVSLAGTFLFRKQGNIYMGEEGSASSANEYLLILYLLCFLFSGGSKWKQTLCYLLYGLYALFTILAGARIEIIMLFLMLLTLKLQYAISFKKMILAAVIGIWGMSIIGAIRTNPLLFLQMNPMEILLPFHHTTDVQASNEGDVYWASERMICMIDEGILTYGERFQSACYYLISPFVQTASLPPVAELTHYKTDAYTTGGGCLSPIYYYVLFGFPGILILSWIFSKALNHLSVPRLTPWKIYAILVITTLPRWFAYSPLHLIKYCLWGILAFMIFLSLDYTFKKYNR